LLTSSIHDKRHAAEGGRRKKRKKEKEKEEQEVIPQSIQTAQRRWAVSLARTIEKPVEEGRTEQSRAAQRSKTLHTGDPSLSLSPSSAPHAALQQK
jgi:hypothetical protein